jgi:hypothetical protein
MAPTIQPVTTTANTGRMRFAISNASHLSRLPPHRRRILPLWQQGKKKRQGLRVNPGGGGKLPTHSTNMARGF